MQQIVKEVFCIKDTEDFDYNDPGKKILSIEISLDGFSYTVLDTEKFRYVALESYLFENISNYKHLSQVLEEITKEKSILTGSYQRLNFAFISQHVTLVPSELFSYTEKNAYIDFNVYPEEDTEIKVDKLNNLSAFAVYPIDRLLLQKINFLFPSCRIRHISTSLIENLLYLVRYGRVSPQLVLHVQKGQFQVLYFHERTLQFYNSYRYQTWDDLFYYLFFVLEQLGLSAEELDLMLYGEVGIESELYKKGKLYFRTLELGPRSDLYKYGECFDDIPHHYFYNLLNLNACG